GRSRLGAEPEVAQSFSPPVDFLGPPPAAEALFDGAQIGDRHHEFGKMNLLFQGRISDVKPELMFVGGESRPDSQSIPPVAIQAQSQFVEIPHCDTPALAAT